MSARAAALKTLLAVEQTGAWANGALKKELAKAKLDGRDAALATRLTFGVLQNRMLLDHYLAAYSSMKIEKLDPPVRQSLRLALYQILYLTKIPESAAVDEAVKLTRKLGRNPRAPGMVNGILRSILRERDRLPTTEREDPLETLSLQYSHPKWLLEEFSRYLSREELVALLEVHNSPGQTFAQVNTDKTTLEALSARLEAEGVTATPHPWLPGCLILTETGNLENLAAFQNGLFYIQDPAARLAVLAAEPKGDFRVLDACAAPGGKSFAAALAMEGRGEILSCDIYPHKGELIQKSAARLGLSSIHPLVWDARVFRESWQEAFDLVIADVPCSGLGVIGKKPEIRYKDPGLMEGLPALQREILCNVSRYVRPGGLLLYATCTLRREENEAVVDAFLQENAAFTLEPFTLPGPIGRVEAGMCTLWPQRLGTDGFFMARIRRSL